MDNQEENYFCSKQYLKYCIESLECFDSIVNTETHTASDLELLELSYQRLRNRRLLSRNQHEPPIVNESTTRYGIERLENVLFNRCDEETINKNENLSDPINPMERISEEKFSKIFGFRKLTVIDILKDIEYGWRNENLNRLNILPIHSLLITLYFLVNGTLAYKLPGILANVFSQKKISQPSVSRIIAKVTSFLADLCPRFIKHPPINRDQENVIKSFESFNGFPSVIGCIGSTHIPIRAPPRHACADYMNDGGFYSYRFWALCGPKKEFFEIITRWPGSSNENNIFNLSEFNQKLESNRYGETYVLANEHYSCSGFVLTPIVNENAMCPSAIQYNESHKLTYIFPQTIELFKRRFQCLTTVLRCKDGK